MADEETEETQASAAADGSLEFTDHDGVLALRLSGGDVIPGAIPVLDESGKLLAVYTAGPPVPPASGSAPDVLAERTVVKPQ
ncbi:hypothetical protein IPZ58_18815 [Streptomyces roseoverticillatus]|uniref:hypothetical protein n=1 Tax=Streptomyces roseoverticillatus TaxID=66429 RepID=UPI001F1D850A|nr:hypothetical protein [Streptomyces roseoverticillatus]MCF3103621.1 hypothetical protein [Streptomyces roseoverticillatus]